MHPDVLLPAVFHLQSGLSRMLAVGREAQERRERVQHTAAAAHRADLHTERAAVASRRAVEVACAAAVSAALEAHERGGPAVAAVVSASGGTGTAANAVVPPGFNAAGAASAAPDAARAQEAGLQVRCLLSFMLIPGVKIKARRQGRGFRRKAYDAHSRHVCFCCWLFCPVETAHALRHLRMHVRSTKSCIAVRYAVQCAAQCCTVLHCIPVPCYTG